MPVLNPLLMHQRVVVGFLNNEGQPTTLVVGKLVEYDLSQEIAPFAFEVPGAKEFRLRLYDVHIEEEVIPSSGQDGEDSVIPSNTGC